VLAGHALHVRAATVVSAEISDPVLHVIWDLHTASRCEAVSWYVPLVHAAHARLLVLLSAPIRSPLLHIGCARQPVFWWEGSAIYLSAGHTAHTVSDVPVAATCTYWPARQLEMAEHSRNVTDVGAFDSH
jgi:hypothetical protein